MKKQNVMPVLVLTVICLVVALLLAAVNMLTAPLIKEREEQKKYDSLREVLDGTFEETTVPETAAKTITAMYKVNEGATLKGYVVTLEVKGYNGPISMTVGVLSDGTVNKVVVTNQSESHGKGGMDAYPDKFSGVAADEVLNVELFTGATITSTAMRSGVADAVNAVTGTAAEPEEEKLPKTDEEIIALAEELLGASSGTLTDVTPEETEAVKRVYRDKANKNYAVYTVVMSQYGTVETETLIHIDSQGTVKGIKKLVWKTSDAMYGYVPPTQEEADVFYNNVVGKNDGNIDNVEIVTNATNTTNSLKAAIKEALAVVKKLSLPKTDEEIIALAEELLGASAGTLIDVTPEETEAVKRVYRDKANKNYAVYTVVMSQYGTVETETLIHIDSQGTVKGIKKLVWKTSDAMYGYVPPTQEEADVFYNNIVGKNIDGVDGVEIVTNATNTTNSLKSAIKEAINAVKDDAKKLELPRTDAEIIALAEELLGTSKGALTDITADTSGDVKRVYLDKKTANYAVYTVVMSQYGTVETETLIHINYNGMIKGIKKLVWKTSDAMYGYVPPTQEEADVFYNNVVGANINNIDDIEVVTNATNTTNSLKAAIKEALTVVEGLDYKPEERPVWRIVGISVLAISTISVAAEIVITKKRRAVK